ncbi:DNA-binding NarL/FixJ family response regulator [Nonomuraea endophytica]|uniref:DNA-binding NarL/FixJ family response regulator n=2 Tax=Nonomuraea endophytica TaxID=714136 RepID=A0A7W8A820_9ACTN|nr:response regulator transcription factor [Nonomuraea endophytica]MBB5081270.1 DNA-binding NarL/FixJ family response regulator [Nonomuraea endophytica]
MKRRTVLVADDERLVRAAFRMLIDSSDDLVTVGEAGTGDEAVALAAELLPDVVLMDIRMPGMTGLEATGRIRALPGAEGVRVLVLTTFDLDEYVYGALRAGASGFLLKDTPAADLLAALRVVADGQALLAPSVTTRLIAEFARRPGGAAKGSAVKGSAVNGRDGSGGGSVGRASVPMAELAGLSEREREVLLLIARGRTNDQIAEHLGISRVTVKTHVRRLLAKLDAHDRAQLVVVAYESGLVTPGH